jgi:hypothetical protein
MSVINYISRLEYEKQISLLNDEIERLKCMIKTERQEYKESFKSLKESQKNEFVHEEYFRESQYIHSLKNEINKLITQNDSLKEKNRLLIEKIESMTETFPKQDMDDYSYLSSFSLV